MKLFPDQTIKEFIIHNYWLNILWSVIVLSILMKDMSFTSSLILAIVTNAIGTGMSCNINTFEITKIHTKQIKLLNDKTRILSTEIKVTPLTDDDIDAIIEMLKERINDKIH